MARDLNLEERLAGLLIKEHPQETARLLESLPADESITVLRSVAVQEAAHVLESMSQVMASACLEAWPDQGLAHLIEVLDPNAAARLLRFMGRANSEDVLSKCHRSSRRVIESILRMPEDSAGALMETRIFSLAGDLTAGEAVAVIRSTEDTVGNYVYVVNSKDVLTGVISFQTLLVAPPSVKLDAIKNSPVERLASHANVKGILRHPGWSRFDALPVVDREEHLLGIVRWRNLNKVAGKRYGKTEMPLLVAIGEMYWVALSDMLQLPKSPAAVKTSTRENLPDG